MARLLWVVWTFALGAIPSFFADDWAGPIVAGPSDLTSVLLVLIALLLAAVIQDGSAPSFHSRWVDSLILGVGAVALFIRTVLFFMSFIYFHPLWLQLSEQASEVCFNLMGALYIPSESLALVGWAFLTLHQSQAGSEAPPARILPLFLGGALWPCFLLLLDIAGSVPDYPSEQVSIFWSITISLTMGALSSWICARMARTGIRRVDLISLFAGFALFRAGVEVAEPFYWTFFESPLTVTIVFLLIYVLVIGAGCTVLRLVSKPKISCDVPLEARDIVEQIDGQAMLADLPHAVRLTEREREVIQDTLSGLTSQQIADKHNLSISTIGTYRHRAYEKMGITKKKELIDLAARRTLSDASQPGKKGVDVEPELNQADISNLVHIVAGILVVALLLLVSPGYIPLSIKPYGLRVEKVTPYLIGALFLLGGIARCSIIEDASYRRSCQAYVDKAATGRDAVFRITVTALGAVAAGWLMATAWLSPFPGFDYLALLFDWMLCRLWASLGIGALLAALGAFYRLPNWKMKTTADVLKLMKYGMGELLLNRPYHIALFGVGLQLISLEDSFFFSDIMVTERFWEVCSAIPHIVLLLMLGLVGVRTLRYKDQFDGIEKTLDFEGALKKRGLSDLQAKVVVLTLDGRTSDEIAAKLFLAPGTVRVYRSRACKTLGVSDLSELGKLK